MTVLLGPGEQFVTGQPTPGGQIFINRYLGRSYLQQTPSGQGINVFADQQQQTITAIEITAIKTDVGWVKVGLTCVHEQDCEH